MATAATTAIAQAKPWATSNCRARRRRAPILSFKGWGMAVFPWEELYHGPASAHDPLEHEQRGEEQQRIPLVPETDRRQRLRGRELAAGELVEQFGDVVEAEKGSLAGGRGRREIRMIGFE